MPSKDTRAKSSNYRRPPVEHQFKKGTSGNPGGRRKKKRKLELVRRAAGLLTA